MSTKRFIWIFVLFLAIPFMSKSQCNNELIRLCVSENGGATYLKEFPVKLKKGKKNQPAPYARFALALKKGSHYRFNIKNDSLINSFAVLQLADDYKIYGSTYDKAGQKDYRAFDFYCKNTGTYYITIQFKEKKEGCAVGVLSLVDVFPVY